MSKEQLIEVVLDIYSSRKDAKEYFDFFTNPDVEKLLDRYRRMAVKEFARNKRHYSKARITVVRRLVRDFASFNVDPRSVVSLMAFIVGQAMETTWTFYTTDSFRRSMVQFLETAADYADDNKVWTFLIEDISPLFRNQGKCSSDFFNELKSVITRRSDR